MKDYLGCILNFKSKDEATMYQPHIIKKICNKFQDLVQEIRKSDLPSAPGSTLMRPKEDEELLSKEKQELYRSGVGMLLYITKYTRPDIANSTREHSKMMDGATEQHFHSLMRLIKYVIDTKNKMLILKLNREKGFIFTIEGYSDADYGSDRDNRRSITGMVIYLCGIPIAWRSRAQKCVTLSTTESEYYAMSELCSEIIYIKNTLEFLQVQVEYPIIVRVDNVGAMFLGNNPSLSQRTKHISIRQHFIRQYVEDEIIKIIFVKLRLTVKCGSSKIW